VDDVNLKKVMDAFDERGLILTDGGMLAYHWVEDEPGVIFIDFTWVQKSHRRRGVASKLIRTAAGLPGVDLVTSRTAVVREELTAMNEKLGRTIERTHKGFHFWSDHPMKILATGPRRRKGR